MPIIQVRNLSFSYGVGELERRVLHNINMDIEQGEIVIMTGPSGSGKTTLLTILGGLRHAKEGSVTVLDQELVNSRERTRMRVRRQTGYIFQQHNLLWPLTAAQNVSMALELNPRLNESQRRRVAAEMLGAVGLADRLHYKPLKLSGGQRQRVSIARALVNRPKIVLADEPTASLDKESGQAAVRIIKKLAKDLGTTILLVTHDYRILDMADRIITLEDGILDVGKAPPPTLKI